MICCTKLLSQIVIGKPTDTSENRISKATAYDIVMNVFMALLMVLAFWLDSRQLLVYDPSP